MIETVQQSINLHRALGHSILEVGLHPPGTKWVINYKGQLGCPKRVYRDKMIDEGNALLRRALSRELEDPSCQ